MKIVLDPGHFDLSAYRILMFFFFLFQSIYFDVDNPKMKIILWINNLLTLKLAYIYQYFIEILRFKFSVRFLHANSLKYESIICR